MVTAPAPHLADGTAEYTWGFNCPTDTRMLKWTIIENDTKLSIDDPYISITFVYDMTVTESTLVMTLGRERVTFEHSSFNTRLSQKKNNKESSHAVSTKVAKGLAQ